MPAFQQAAEAPPAQPPAPPAWGAPSTHEGTTVMPAWQPPPADIAVPAPAGVGDTVVMGGTPAATPAPADGGPHGELRIESGPDTGHTYQLGTHALRIGRSPDNELILRDPATSGHHAKLERRANQFFIVDLGSTNGTLVNGEPVQEKELKHGDRITIGQNSLTFNLP